MNPIKIKIFDDEEEDARSDDGPPRGDEFGLGSDAEQFEDRVRDQDEGQLDDHVAEEELLEAPLVEGPVVGLVGLDLVLLVRGDEVGDEVGDVEQEIERLVQDEAAHACHHPLRVARLLEHGSPAVHHPRALHLLLLLLLPGPKVTKAKRSCTTCVVCPLPI